MYLDNVTIAIVHDLLTEFGGAERVLQVLLRIFPHAHLYAAYADEQIIQKHFTSYPAIRRRTMLTNHPWPALHASLFQCIAPFIWKRFDFKHYDIVFSCPSYLMCNFITVKRSLHIQYIQSIPKNLVGFIPKTTLQCIFPYGSMVLKQYKKALSTTPYVLSNSNFVQQTLRERFGVESSVIYPPVRVPTRLPIQRKRKYFICVSRLDIGKNLDLAIKTCTLYKIPLKIIGKASDRSYERFLISLAGPTIEFLGEKTYEEIKIFFRDAIALLCPSQTEDFGIVPIEAISCGLPVVAFYGGALKETIIHGKNGVFFYEHNAQSLIEAIWIVATMRFDQNHMHAWAFSFKEERFIREIRNYVYRSYISTWRTRDGR